MPLQILQADITTLQADAIVCSANNYLHYDRFGASGALLRSCNAEQLLSVCRKIGYCETGDAVITPSFGLSCAYLIHAVGPVWQGGTADEERLLRSCYTRSLDLAYRHGARSIAFPLISSGVRGYPRERALSAATSAIGDWLMENDADMLVMLTLFRDSVGERYRDIYAYIAQTSPELESSLRPPREEAPVETSSTPFDLDDDQLSRLFESISSNLRKLPPESEDSDHILYCQSSDHRTRRFASRESCLRDFDLSRSPAEDSAASAPPASERVLDSAPYPESEPPLDSAPSLESARSRDNVLHLDAEASSESEPSPESTLSYAPAPIPESESTRESAPHLAPPPVSTPFLASERSICTEAPSKPSASRPRPAASAPSKSSARDLLRDDADSRGILSRLRKLMQKSHETFRDMLLRLIDERGLSDPEVYKRANLDRRLFSKIRSNPDYQPTKNTVLALAIALRLNLDQTTDLLRLAGFALSPTSKSDLIVQYFIDREIYSIHAVNEMLFEFDQKLLGAQQI